MSRPRLASPDYTLVRRPNRRKWYVQWTDDAGKTQRISSGLEAGPGKPSAEAVAWLMAFRERQERPPSAMTVADLMDARLKEAEGRVASTKGMIYFHGKIKAHFGGTQAEAVTATGIRDYMRRRRSAPTSCTRELEELRSAFILAKRRGWIETVPEFTFPPKKPPRDIIITKEEGDRLIAAAASHHVRLFIWIGLRTGQRKSAILGLTWDRVDLERGKLDFCDPTRQITKKRRAVVDIMDPSLLAALRHAYDNRLKGQTHVIWYHGAPLANIKKGFAEAARLAGLPHVTPHVMKHAVISWLAEKHSVDLIADFTATSPATVRRVYRKVNSEAMKPLAETLAGGLIGTPGLETPDPGNPQVVGKIGARDGIRTRDPLDHNERPQRLCA